MTIINTLIPIFFLILLGYFFKQIKFPNEDFWKHLDKFNYYVLFPSLLIYKLSIAQIENIDAISFLSSSVAVLLCICFLLILYNKIFPFENSSFTSIFQGAIRFNTYVYLALVDAFLGDVALVLALFLITFLIPLINILCIAVFSLYLPTNRVTLFSFVKSIITNPLIVACVLGGMINYLGINLPTMVINTLSILSSAALSLGLLSVGVGLHLSSLSTTKLAIFISSFVKLVLYPIIAFIVGYSVGLAKLELMVLVLFAAMPTASSSYVLARQLGGDLKLISSLISIQTILSIITISAFLHMLNSQLF